LEVNLDSQRRTAVFRILQEILTNVRRHAEATRVWVDLRGEGESFILEVRDNGKGIPPERLKHVDGLGILGMRERALVFGGYLEIDSEPGKGTSVSVTIPLGESP
jgi:signal transduction histidine kinase